MKKIILKLFSFVYFFTCFYSFFTMYAHAYIDPSAVTYVIQAVAAVFIALGAVLTVFRHRIAQFFKKNKETEKREIHVDEDIVLDEEKAEDK
ncbi:MAG: hypothetical protein NC429_02240 [Lachnospiraceae bacterium]|nr:hypothetical protein [Lachnospiraceae bacterium]